MPYHTSMKVGYEFKGSRMLPYGNGNSILYHTWINNYCKQYRFQNLPLDANAIAGLISTEGTRWNPKQVAGDYNQTGSVGLGQFITKPYAVAQEFGLNSRADQENPELNIKAICNKLSGHLRSADGDYNKAYRMYNAGSNYNSQQAINNAKNFNKYYTWWAKYGDASISSAPVKTNNNAKAVSETNAKQIADNKAYNDLIAKLHAQDVKSTLEDKKALDKAKLTNNPIVVSQVQKQAQINAEDRKKIVDKIALDKKNRDYQNSLLLNNAYNSNHPQTNTPSQPLDARNKLLPTPIKEKPNYIKSGIPILGVIATIIILNNAFIPKEELE